MACLDTTVFLDLRGRSGKRRQARAEAVIQQLVLQGDALTTTRINCAELYVGVALADNPAREGQLVDDSLANIEILELDEAGAQDFARIRADLQRRGRLVGDLDTLIAAIAVSNHEPLVTANARHFADMPGLIVIEYAD